VKFEGPIREVGDVTWISLFEAFGDEQREEVSEAASKKLTIKK
jgi:hypothetical protein